MRSLNFSSLLLNLFYYFSSCPIRRTVYFHYIIRTKKNILFNGKKIESNSRGIYDFSFGKYSSAQNEKRLFGLLALYSLEYIVVYEMEKGIVKDERYSFYVHFRNRVISTLAKGILNENLKVSLLLPRDVLDNIYFHLLN